MDKNLSKRPGNILGDARAEADLFMLTQAFVETNDFRALQTTSDFSFVVGRRGTGKTAIFLKLREDLQVDKRIFLSCLKPEEYDSLALVSTLRKIGTGRYDEIRPTARVLWRISMLLEVAQALSRHWKFGNTAEAEWIRRYLMDKKSILLLNILQRCNFLFNESKNESETPESIPGIIATRSELSSLEDHVRQGLCTIGTRAVFLFDGLDEGWGLDETSTGALGGLAIAVASFRDKGIPIDALLFIRDNVFRSLASLDRDFSRHIEGSTLRLHWDEDSLLHLVANRLRVMLNMTSTENNIRIWNRFAHRELKDRAGFQQCLHHTLYRPRDVLILLNQAAVHAARENRTEIVASDVDASSKQISLDRLTDLMKEYDAVFPGLRLIIDNFKGTQAFQPLHCIRAQLDKFIEEQQYNCADASDVAILGTSAQMIDILYSIGFIGLEDHNNAAIQFCHDGAPASIFDKPDEMRVALHPCYWSALDVHEKDTDSAFLITISDDYVTRKNPQAQDMRIRLLGQLINELPECPEGREGASTYETWVLRTCRVLFAGNLSNLELHPSQNSVQQRDVIATNSAERGFWRRVFEDYKCRQVVFEAKNYASLGPDEFRQALAYSGRQYGKVIFIIHRADEEGLEPNVRGWIKELWDQHEVLVVTIPTCFFLRCLKKVRNPERRDYIDQQLTRRLDVFERNYLSLRQSRK